ncbi:unnamed protein product [Linum trigynum]|uniref:F-box domain-containing protein n=1 Tax=Linum trigynum TaxID=586398 RepID=A0AAV2GFK1_9ROSI
MAAAAATSITDLPEPLVLRILSDLPFPTVAKICTTSRRLYSAWNQIPHLHSVADTWASRVSQDTPKI